MEIKIKEESYYSEQGKRANNEDNGGWQQGQIYLVCDGVGGNERGEIASQIVTNTLLELYKKDSLMNPAQAIIVAEKNMSNYVSQKPEALGMASTLAMVLIQSIGVRAIWVGDSRIYQLRNGEIIFKSRDHSWVNEAVDAGILTAEEAINHPKSNVITRAIQGTHKQVESQEIVLQDVQPDDFFLLCTDGVLETWSDEEICSLFISFKTTNDLVAKIKEECLNSSKDNNTAIVFKISEVIGSDQIKNHEYSPAIDLAIPSSSGKVPYLVTTASSDKSKIKKIFYFLKIIKTLNLFLIMAVLGLAMIAFVLYKNKMKSDNNKVPQDKSTINVPPNNKEKNRDIEEEKKNTIKQKPSETDDKTE